MSEIGARKKMLSTDVNVLRSFYPRITWAKKKKKQNNDISGRDVGQKKEENFIASIPGLSSNVVVETMQDAPERPFLTRPLLSEWLRKKLSLEKFKMLSKRRRSRIMKYPSIYAPSENAAFKRHDISAKRRAFI